MMEERRRRIISFLPTEAQGFQSLGFVVDPPRNAIDKTNPPIAATPAATTACTASFALALLLLFTPVARADFTFIHASDTHAGSPAHVKTDATLFKEMTGLD